MGLVTSTDFCVVFQRYTLKSREPRKNAFRPSMEFSCPVVCIKAPQATRTNSFVFRHGFEATVLQKLITRFFTCLDFCT